MFNNKLVHTLSGIVLAGITFIIVALLVHFVFGVRDFVIGDDSQIQKWFLIIASHAAGGYFAILNVRHFLNKANLLWVWAIFSLPIFFIYIVLSIVNILLFGEPNNLTWSDHIVGWFSGLAAIIAALIPSLKKAA